MRKIRFFYRIKILGLLILLWMLLLNESYVQNRYYQKQWKETEKVKKETIEKETIEKDKPQELSEKSVEEKKIRVLLMDSGYETYFHPEVILECAGKQYVFQMDDEFFGQSATEFFSEDGVLISSIQRQCGNPVYQGTIYVRKEKEGFLIINELNLEDYLKAVVPSEMPASYEMQALMAQAVCARTYAYKQMENQSLKAFGADVDDSVNFQVYQNLSSQEQTTQAVEATKGQVLTYNGELIEAFYFSTSSGKTSTDEVWGNETVLPYLKSVACTFDSEEVWSEWEVCLPWETIQQRTREYFEVEAEFLSMEIVRKAQNGAATELRVITEEGAYSVQQEYEIRKFLSPKGCVINGKDGSQNTGGALLPSSCFVFEIVEGEEILLTGKGYGHGVGMSQNGANEMARRGYLYQEILHYFFNDVTIENR